jgi:D-alanyl-D-alanine carboxypeptidase/D-alanyl-D-alanine-endopeptidase (penicillin-binding protein 4)
MTGFCAAMNRLSAPPRPGRWRAGLAVLLLAAAWTGVAPRGAEAAGGVPGLGLQDALLLESPDSRTLLAHQPGQPLVPASTLKVLTSLAAFHYLGEDFRFETRFFHTEAGDLVIQGTGDPLLISEVVAEICDRLAERVTVIRDIRLDESYFADPLEIPGVSSSTNPYDAPNGALCVNFNTVTFRQAGGRLVSGEPQTPLLPMALERIRRTRQPDGRIILTRHDRDTLRYAGELFRHFLEERGVQVQGRVRPDAPEALPETPLWVHRSPFSLADNVTRLLEYSNNFIANQLLVTCGAVAFGPPGDLAKGVAALEAYAREIGIEGAALAEGSGISRANRVTARDLMRALATFQPQRALMRCENGDCYKTGTLSGVRSRVGFLEGPGEAVYRYVVLINTPGRTTDLAMRRIREALERHASQKPAR